MLCRWMVCTTNQGTVTFRSAAMPLFFSSFRLQAIDNSHNTLALACLIQVKLDRDCGRLNCKSHGEDLSIYRGSSFSGYAGTHQQYHFQRSDGLAKWVETQATSRSRSEPRTDEAEEPTKALLARISDLQVEDDWVFLGSVDSDDVARR